MLWMSAPCAASSVHAEPLRQFRGVWLIAPKPHDFFIETGVVTAEYPVLAIDEDGIFRAYRFGTTCASEMTRAASEVERIEPCMRNLRISNVDRLSGLAILVAEGRLVRADAGWLLQPSDTRSLVDAIQNASPSDKRVDKVPYQFTLFVRLFGEPLSASAADNQLIFSSSKQSFSYEFVRVDIEQLVGVGSLLNVIGHPLGQYFRCAMNNIHDVALLRGAERVQAAYNRADQLFFQLLRGKSQEDPSRLQLLRQEASDLAAAFVSRYENDTDLIQRFGVFAKCPERDLR